MTDISFNQIGKSWLNSFGQMRSVANNWNGEKADRNFANFPPGYLDSKITNNNFQ